MVASLSGVRRRDHPYYTLEMAIPLSQAGGAVRAYICYTSAKHTYLYNDHRQTVDVGLLGPGLPHAPHIALNALEFGCAVPIRVRGLLRADCSVDSLSVHRQRIKPKISDPGTPFCVNEDT